MGYDRGDSFPFNFEPNGILFGSKLKRKLSLQSYLIQFEKKLKYNFSLCISNFDFKLYHFNLDPTHRYCSSGIYIYLFPETV